MLQTWYALTENDILAGCGIMLKTQIMLETLFSMNNALPKRHALIVDM
jgi:hypothetical protein